MNMTISAIALAMAAPAVAQTAPAPNHPSHQGMDHGKHHAGKHDCKSCCEKMKGKDGKMECADKKGEAKPGSTDASDHRDHAGH